MDPQDEVIKIVDGKGEVAPEYGGYEIKVVKPDLFPRHTVLDLLIETGQEVWITKKHWIYYSSAMLILGGEVACLLDKDEQRGKGRAK